MTDSSYKANSKNLICLKISSLNLAPTRGKLFSECTIRASAVRVQHKAGRPNWPMFHLANYTSSCPRSYTSSGLLADNGGSAIVKCVQIIKYVSEKTSKETQMYVVCTYVCVFS